MRRNDGRAPIAFFSLALQWPMAMAMNECPLPPPTNYYLTLKEVAHLPPQPTPFFPFSFSQPLLPHLSSITRSLLLFLFSLLFFFFFFFACCWGCFFLPAVEVVAVWFHVSIICSIFHFVALICCVLIISCFVSMFCGGQLCVNWVDMMWRVFGLGCS